ncbi:MAG: hypothetical protein LBU46_04850 [Candidatus Accumulibacter sp.]|jgi:hypothetical protein|nr:hypothetical protein [Accumulibacter sp.]
MPFLTCSALASLLSQTTLATLRPYLSSGEGANAALGKLAAVRRIACIIRPALPDSVSGNFHDD